MVAANTSSATRTSCVLIRGLPCRGVLRLREFLAWCRRNEVPGFLGEFGIPVPTPAGANVLAGALTELTATQTSACYWAAGEWWNDYRLSIQPRNDMRDPAPQQDIVTRFLGDRTTMRQPS